MTPRADAGRLRAHVEVLQGERHPRRSPASVEAALGYVSERLGEMDLEARREPFRFRGRLHHNLTAMRPGRDPAAAPVVLGAHVDTRAGTPGADDNASGVAGVLEAARLLTSAPSGPAPLELAVFDLEERQGWTYRVGSRRWVEAARRRWAAGGGGCGPHRSRARPRPAGALILEMIGYRTTRPGSQHVPLPLRWLDLPRTGDFVAALADRGSRELLETFVAEAAGAAPDLPVVGLAVPLRGWLLPAVRRSDNASFWAAGWPALMITDTADLRNPHYHGAGDRADTLDWPFMASVVDAVVATARKLGA